MHGFNLDALALFLAIVVVTFILSWFVPVDKSKGLKVLIIHIFMLGIATFATYVLTVSWAKPYTAMGVVALVYTIPVIIRFIAKSRKA